MIPVPVPGPGKDRIDTSRPNTARVYDYWLGGKDNFAADRELAARIEKISPAARTMAIRNREFLARAVPWCARELGISQFLDLGSGLPAAENIHESAREVIADATVAYVDSDEVVVSHGQALLAGSGGVAAVLGDLRDPGAVLGNPDVRAVIGLDRPVAVVCALVLHFMSADEARTAVAGYVKEVAPGSAVIISCGRNDDPVLWERVQAEMSRAAQLYNHTRDEILGFFAGLDMVLPGLVPARAWRGGMPSQGPGPDSPAYALCGVAVKTRS